MNRPGRLVVAGALALGACAFASAPASAQDRARTDSTAQVFPVDRVVAVVGKKVITWVQLLEAYTDEQQRRQAAGAPPLAAADSMANLRRLLDAMIDEQLLLQKADDFTFEINEAEIAAAVDARIRQIRAEYPSEQEFRNDLRVAGFNTPEDLRRRFIEQERDRRRQRATIDTLTKLGHMPTVSVSEKEVEHAFDSLKVNLQRRGPIVSFRQIVIKPVWSDSADAVARALTDSLLAALRAGASFDSLARRFSADSGRDGQPGSAQSGGDLGWFRRGAMVPEFDRAAFSLAIDQLSAPVRSEYGYHIIRVDRIRPGEVRARHILIQPTIGAADVLRARTQLERIADAVRAGADFDSIANIHHDAIHRRKVDGQPIADLPPEYIEALDDLKPGELSKVFEVVMVQGGVNKAGLMLVGARNDTGEWTLDEARERLRSDLQSAGSWRRLLDNLRRQTYVSIRLQEPPRSER